MHPRDVYSTPGLNEYAKPPEELLEVRYEYSQVYEKPPLETMRERAHVGSAQWVEAPVIDTTAGYSYSVADIRDMKMTDYVKFRQDNKRVVYKTPFDTYLDARNAYIDGSGTIEAMIALIRLEDDERYDRIFELDPAYQHREPRSRWTPWRWLGRGHR